MLISSINFGPLGNKGIGKALCLKLLKDHADTFVYLGSRDATRGKEAVSEIIESVGGDAAARVEFLPIDVGDEASVKAASNVVANKFGPTLYAIVNNAAVGFGPPLRDTLNTNVYGPYFVTNAFLPLLKRTSDAGTTGRIVNISSAVGPNYVAKCDAAGVDSTVFTDPGSTWDQIVDRMNEVLAAEAATPGTEKDAYGLSKACLNAYTVQTALQHPDLLVNSCSPGFINTDLTKGYGATNTPEQGTVSALHCLFGPDVGTGKYFGSDAVRSPINKYRAPGDAPYEP